MTDREQKIYDLIMDKHWEFLEIEFGGKGLWTLHPLNGTMRDITYYPRDGKPFSKPISKEDLETEIREKRETVEYWIEQHQEMFGYPAPSYLGDNPDMWYAYLMGKSSSKFLDKLWKLYQDEEEKEA